MKRLLIIFSTILALINICVGCDSDSYSAVTDIKEYETYNVFATSYSDYVINNQIYEMRIYKDIDKVTIFNSKNHSKCTIYKRVNYVDKSSDWKTLDNGQKYKIYDIEFDLIVGTNSDGSDKLDHYKIEMDMNPVSTLNEKNIYVYGKRLFTKTDSNGKVTVVGDKIGLQLIESIAAMSKSVPSE